MTAVKFAPRSPESLFALFSYRQAPETETEYRLVLDSVHLDNDSAERLAVRGGALREVREVPFNVGFPGSPLWEQPGMYTLRFGIFPEAVQGMMGSAFGDQALLPDFSDEEWSRYRSLALAAGRNPLGAEFEQRRAEMEKFTTDTGRAKKLFAVLSPEHDLVAVFDPSTDVHAARVMFREAVAEHPELADHRLRELHAGVELSPFGEYVTVDDALSTTELLGNVPDGSVFIVPGERTEYTLQGAQLLTADGHEADLLALVRAGLRLRTAEDVSDAAYEDMERLVAEARGEHA